VPLADTESVLRLAARKLGAHARRLPDGETGARTNWIAWQLKVFESMPALESEIVDMGYIKRPKFRLRAGVRADEIAFPALGYASAALASWDSFAQLQAAGVIPAHVRFQVCLPTPLAPVFAFFFNESHAAVEPRYEAKLLAELNEILVVVPHDKLAVQWDTAWEFAVLEGVAPSILTDPEREILERLVRLGEQVPAGVELGYHLCYGDSGHKHFKEPADAAKLVSIANGTAHGLSRRLDWLHLPVPRERFDDAYFAPLAKLALPAHTELYLGLIHYTDGVPGAQRRIDAARKVLSQFGVSTECGLGRRAAETIAPLLDLHTAVAAPRR
jgi:hypothetical protein